MNASARACMHTFSRKEGEVGWNRARTFVALLERRSGSDSLRGRGKLMVVVGEEEGSFSGRKREKERVEVRKAFVCVCTCTFTCFVFVCSYGSACVCVSEREREKKREGMNKRAVMGLQVARKRREKRAGGKGGATFCTSARTQ